MDFTDQGGQHMARLQIIVVTGPIQIRWHCTDEVGAVLMAVGLAQFNARDFCDGVGFVGRLEWACQ